MFIWEGALIRFNVPCIQVDSTIILQVCFYFYIFFFKTESKTLMQMLTDKCMDRQRNIQKGECLNILVLQMKFYKIF